MDFLIAFINKSSVAAGLTPEVMDADMGREARAP